MPAAPWFVNTSAPASDGWLASFARNTRAPEPRFMRHDLGPRHIYLGEQISDTPFRIGDRDLTDLELCQVGVGLKDTACTGGTFALTVNTDGTGLTALAFDISAAALETALDANPAISGLGTPGVTVTKTGTLYRITVNATNQALTFAATATALTPPGRVIIGNPVAAASGVSAVYTLQVLLDFFAYSEDWTVTDSGTLAIAQLVAGSVGVAASYHITLDTIAQGGSFRFSWANPQITLLTVGANTAVKARWQFAVQYSNSIDGTFFDLPAESAETARVWFDSSLAPIGTHTAGVTIASVDTATDIITTGEVHLCVVDDRVRFHTTNTLPPPLVVGQLYWVVTEPSSTELTVSATQGGAAVNLTGAGTGDHILRKYNEPPEPVPGRLISVAGYVGLTETSFNLTYRTYAAIAADTGFEMLGRLYSQSSFNVGALTAGTRDPVFDSDLGHVSISTVVEGSAGVLAGVAAAVLHDQNGSVGVYLTTGVENEVPAIAAACTRQLAIEVTGGASASTAAGEVNTAIAADAQFGSAVVGNVVTVTDTYGGTRGATFTSEGGLSASIHRAGSSLSVSVDGTATASTFEALLDDQWEVESDGDNGWTLTRTGTGVCTAPTVTDEGLTFPSYLTGVPGFSTLALEEYFASVTADTVRATLEIKLTFTGDEPACVLQIPCVLTRDLLSGDPSYPTYTSSKTVLNLTGTITDYLGGTSTKLDSISTTRRAAGTLAAFVHATDGLRWYALYAGTDAEDAVTFTVIRPDDYHATTNAKVWKTV